MPAPGNMTPAQVELWSKLEAFAFDAPGTRLTFARRLARENGWTAAFAEQVLGEYRRFVFLAMEAGHPVSPSEPVDQAWHLHLTYTESYWQGLCAGVLGRRLHHHPTKGGAEEAAKFDGQYQRTLESYRRLFGGEPPGEVWAAAETREHAKAGGHRWVDTATHWVIPKWAAWAGAAGVAALVFLLGAAGCSAPQLGLFNVSGREFLGIYVAMVIGGLVLAALVRHALCTPHDPGADDGGDPKDNFEIAYLSGGAVRVLQTALVSLHADKAIVLERGDEPRVKRGEPPTRALPDIEVLVWGQLPEKGPAMSLTAIQESLRPAYEKMEASLLRRGFLSANADKATRVGLAIALVAPVIGLIRIGTGLARGRPVLFLVLMTLVSLVFVAAFFLSWRKQRRSGRGSKFIKALREHHRAKDQKSKNLVNPAAVPLHTAAALFGLAVLPLYGHAAFSEDLKKSLGDAGGGCGSSCGGGGDGCGGGGCGGGCGGCGGGD